MNRPRSPSLGPPDYNRAMEGSDLMCLAVCIVAGPNHPVIIMAALILAEMGQQSIALTFWAIPSSILTGTAAAGGIAMIQSVGQLGAWLGPWAFGLIKQSTGSNNVALLCLAAAPALSAVLVVLVGHTAGRPGPHSKPHEIAADQKTNLMRRLFSFVDSSSGGVKSGR